jgi:hypothetical protein
MIPGTAPKECGKGFSLRKTKFVKSKNQTHSFGPGLKAKMRMPKIV